MGTGITVGPLTLSPGVIQRVSDPAVFTENSTACQIQNASGFALSVNAAGQPYSIQPFTATTIPLGGTGSDVIITPSSSLLDQVGTATFVFLLPGDEPPIVDGPLNSAVANQRVALKSTAATGTHSFTVPLQSTDESLVVVIAGTIHTNVNLTVTGNVTGIEYEYQNIPGFVGTEIRGPFLVFGAIDTQVTVTLTPTVGTDSYTVTVIATTSTYQYSQQVFITQDPFGYPVPLDVVEMGGDSQAQITLTGGTQTLLAAPPAGFSNVIKRTSLQGGPASQFVSIATGGAVLSVFYTGTPPLSDDIGGIPLQASVTATLSGGVASGVVSIFYDQIVSPVIG